MICLLNVGDMDHHDKECPIAPHALGGCFCIHPHHCRHSERGIDKSRQQKQPVWVDFLATGISLFPVSGSPRAQVLVPKTCFGKDWASPQLCFPSLELCSASSLSLQPFLPTRPGPRGVSEGGRSEDRQSLLMLGGPSLTLKRCVLHMSLIGPAWPARQQPSVDSGPGLETWLAQEMLDLPFPMTNPLQVISPRHLSPRIVANP